jgi:hypothetical protein
MPPKRTRKESKRPLNGLMGVCTVAWEGKIITLTTSRLHPDADTAREAILKEFMEWASHMDIVVDFGKVKGETWHERAVKFIEMCEDGKECNPKLSGKKINIREIYYHFNNGMIVPVLEAQRFKDLKSPDLI